MSEVQRAVSVTVTVTCLLDCKGQAKSFSQLACHLSQLAIIVVNGNDH